MFESIFILAVIIAVVVFLIGKPLMKKYDKRIETGEIEKEMTMAKIEMNKPDIKLKRGIIFSVAAFVMFIYINAHSPYSINAGQWQLKEFAFILSMICIALLGIKGILNILSVTIKKQ
jgi:hypothetical protein